MCDAVLAFCISVSCLPAPACPFPALFVLDEWLPVADYLTSALNFLQCKQLIAFNCFASESCVHNRHTITVCAAEWGVIYIISSSQEAATNNYFHYQIICRLLFDIKVTN